jgi:Glycosyl hydrolases family 18
MGWTKKSDVAQYASADWSNFEHQESNCNLARARRIATMNPEITFFSLCREPMVLNGTGSGQNRVFQAGDAVFFSGQPWYGSAPQCDSYEKHGMAVAYSNASSADEFKKAACYLTADGMPALDVMCIFAANYASGDSPYFRANNNNPPTTNEFNANIEDILKNGVAALQEAGIVVLLTVLNGHAPVGWSEFTSKTDAQKFADYLHGIVTKYNLDGIDIDDEYSAGNANDTSLSMVTYLMKKTMPGKLITKALWNDLEYFQATWKDTDPTPPIDVALAQNLDYGWEMTYGASASVMLPAYVQNLSVGMRANTVCKGYSPGLNAPGTTQTDVQWIIANGYGGVMTFTFDDSGGKTLMGELVDELYGAGNWTLDPTCAS